MGISESSSCRVNCNSLKRNPSVTTDYMYNKCSNTHNTGKVINVYLPTHACMAVGCLCGHRCRGHFTIRGTAGTVQELKGRNHLKN